jgi:hypothetical protein
MLYVGENMNLSRQHARIAYNFEAKVGQGVTDQGVIRE